MHIIFDMDVLLNKRINHSIKHL